MLEVYDAIAYMHGSDYAPELYGTVKFLGISEGTWVEAEIFGLPDAGDTVEGSQNAPFVFNIHEFGTCGRVHGDAPFAAAGEGWNPAGEPCGRRAGDFPALLSNGGTAKMLFFSNRFLPEDIIGRSVVIHSLSDCCPRRASETDSRIACGVVERGAAAAK